jgi:hypothetical protein
VFSDLTGLAGDFVAGAGLTGDFVVAAGLGAAAARLGLFFVAK